MLVGKSHIDQCTERLGAPALVAPTSWTWNIDAPNGVRAIVMTITTDVLIDEQPCTIITAQTPQGYVEMHNVTGILSIEPDEVMFLARHNERFSSLVVGRTGTVSQFANIHASLLRADLTEINPAALLAALQLSLADGLLEG